MESARFRSLAFSNPKKPRKLAFSEKEFHEKRDSANVFVVFKTEESAKLALAHNGALFMGKHIRVDLAAPPVASGSGEKKQHNHKCSVFIGNVPFDAEEEPIREFFAPCGKVLNVRLIRDQHANVGKGFGYVLFEDRASVKFALALNGTKFAGPARITSQPLPPPVFL